MLELHQEEFLTGLKSLKTLTEIQNPEAWEDFPEILTDFQTLGFNEHWIQLRIFHMHLWDPSSDRIIN